MPQLTLTHPNTEGACTLHLLLIDDVDGRRAIALEAGNYSLGRDPSNGIVLNGSLVSRHHALMIRVPLPNHQFAFRLMDGSADGKRSTNHTRVNGIVCFEHDLKDGDEITFSPDAKAKYVLQSMTERQADPDIQSAQIRSIKSDNLDKQTTQELSLANLRVPLAVTAPIPLQPQSYSSKTLLALVAGLVITVGSLVGVALNRASLPPLSPTSEVGEATP